MRRIYNWLKLRTLVFLYLFPLRLHLFHRYVSELEAMHLRRVQRDLWELTLSGDIRRELGDDGECRYFPPNEEENETH